MLHRAEELSDDVHDCYREVHPARAVDRVHGGSTANHEIIQQVQAGLKAIYLSGSQVAADANDAGQMYPDQSLYPANSVPQAKKISAGFARLKANGWRFSEIPAQCFVARRPPLGWKNMRTPSV